MACSTAAAAGASTDASAEAAGDATAVALPAPCGGEATAAAPRASLEMCKSSGFVEEPTIRRSTVHRTMLVVISAAPSGSSAVRSVL
eukprot:4065761-Prymnesium_polylepis.1